MSDTPFSPGPWWWLFLVLFTPLVLIGIVYTIVAAAGSPMAYPWLGAGGVIFFVLNKFVIKGKDGTIRVFSHELNHAVVSLMCFKKVHAFHVEHDHGVIRHTGGGRFSTVPITMAPYCLPLFSYALLIVRSVMLPEFYWIADLLIGITVGFYISVFKHQIGPHQPDITDYRHRVFPYWFIFTFIVFNANIIIYSLLPGKNLFLAFADTFVNYWHYIIIPFKMLW